MLPFRVALRVLRGAEKEGDCLVSHYSTGSHGYAQVGWVDYGKRTVTLCHLVAWRALRGNIPDGMTVDHICKNKRCIRSDHLRLLTNFENARRTNGWNWPLGECRNGHDNSWLRKANRSGKMECHKCRMDRQREYRARQRSENPPRQMDAVLRRTI